MHDRTPMKKVTTIVLNGFTNDSRVLKENLSLKKAGFDVKILALLKEGLPEFEIIDGLPVHRLSLNKKKQIQQKSQSFNEVVSQNIEINNHKISPQEDNATNTAENTPIVKPISLSDIYNKEIPFLGKLFILLKLFIRFIRKAIRFAKRTIKKTIRFVKRTIKKIFNRYFRLHKLKFNMLFVRKAKDSDIIHCNDLYTLPMGVMVKKLYNKNVKIVYDAHEYETEVNGLSGNKKRFRKIMERILIHYADKVICVSDAIANEYVRLYGIEKPALVLNTPPYQIVEKKNFFREKLGIDENQTIFLYQGGLSKGRGIEILLETFKKTDPSNIIVFMGYGPLEALVIEAATQYDNIYFYEAVSPSVLLGYTSSADFGILFYENNCLNHYYCSPNKMFEYLMAGIPVIASNLYEMKRLVENNKIGIVAKDNTPEGLKEAIEKAVLLDKDTLQKNIRKVQEVYNWEEQEKVLLDLYKDL